MFEPEKLGLAKRANAFRQKYADTDLYDSLLEIYESLECIREDTRDVEQLVNAALFRERSKATA